MQAGHADHCQGCPPTSVCQAWPAALRATAALPRIRMPGSRALLPAVVAIAVIEEALAGWLLPLVVVGKVSKALSCSESLTWMGDRKWALAFGHPNATCHVRNGLYRAFTRVISASGILRRAAHSTCTI